MKKEKRENELAHTIARAGIRHAISEICNKGVYENYYAMNFDYRKSETLFKFRIIQKKQKLLVFRVSLNEAAPVILVQSLERI